MFFSKLINVLALIFKLFARVITYCSHKILTILQTIINFFYTRENYYTAKSGLFIDFFFKKNADFIHREVTVWLSLFFVDKFILSRATKQFFTSISHHNSVFNKLNSNLTFTFLSFFVFCLLASLWVGACYLYIFL